MTLLEGLIKELERAVVSNAWNATETSLRELEYARNAIKNYHEQMITCKDITNNFNPSSRSAPFTMF